MYVCIDRAEKLQPMIDVIHFQGSQLLLVLIHLVSLILFQYRVKLNLPAFSPVQPAVVCS